LGPDAGPLLVSPGCAPTNRAAIKVAIKPVVNLRLFFVFIVPPNSFRFLSLAHPNSLYLPMSAVGFRNITKKIVRIPMRPDQRQKNPYFQGVLKKVILFVIKEAAPALIGK
jgi:hypothetical protein